MTSPDPTWQGIPAELKLHSVQNLNILDRSLLRNVSETDRIFADRFSYSIDTVEVLANTTQLVISIQEAGGSSYKLPSDSAASNCAAILKNPMVSIENLRIISQKEAFGASLQNFVKTLQDAALQQNSLKVARFVIASDEFPQGGNLRFSHEATAMELKELLAFCNPADLKKVVLHANIADELFTEISKLEQWKSAGSIEIGKNQKIPRNIFESWTGTHLKIKECEERKPVFQELWELFKNKPIGSSFQIFSWTVTDIPPIALHKFNDDNKSLYVFEHMLFFRGYVRADDGTHVGRSTCNFATERRHIERTAVGYAAWE